MNGLVSAYLTVAAVISFYCLIFFVLEVLCNSGTLTREDQRLRVRLARITLLSPLWPLVILAGAFYLVAVALGVKK